MGCIFEQNIPFFQHFEFSDICMGVENMYEKVLLRRKGRKHKTKFTCLRKSFGYIKGSVRKMNKY